MFEDFTGHDANWIEDSKHIKNGVFVQIGYADGLGFKCKNRKYEIEFKARQAKLLINPDGLSFAITGQNIGFNDINKTCGNALKKVEYIKYTTKRDGITEKYIHTFKKKAQPQFKFLMRNHIQSVGGQFDFTDAGFTDR
jgi:hypothetical protein